DVAANWRLCMHITLDDYHAVAVHPTTFGRGGYLTRADMSYFRFGLHSAFLTTPKPDAFAAMRAGCQAGTFQPACYTILQVVRNLLRAFFQMQRNAGSGRVEVFEPPRHDACRLRSWLYPAPFAAERPWLRRLTEPLRMPIVHHYAKQIFREDNEVCERLQQVV